MAESGSSVVQPDVRTREGRAKLMGRLPKFSDLSPDDVDALAGQALVRQLGAGVDLYLDGAVADSFAIVVMGTISKRGVVNKRPLGPNTVVGTLPLLRRNERLRRRTAGLMSLSPVMLIEIPYRALDLLPSERREAFLDSIAEEALTLIERLEHAS